MDKIRSKWEFLLQCRPYVKCVIGNAMLIGGAIGMVAAIIGAAVGAGVAASPTAR